MPSVEEQLNDCNRGTYLASNPNHPRPLDVSPPSEELFERVVNFQNELIDYFTGGRSLEERRYQAMRRELLDDQRYGNLAPRGSRVTPVRVPFGLSLIFRVSVWISRAHFWPQSLHPPYI